MLINNKKVVFFNRLWVDCLLSDNKFVKIYNFFVLNNYVITDDINKSNIIIFDLCWVWQSYIDLAEEKILTYIDSDKQIILIWCISDVLREKYWDKLIYVDSKSYNDIEKYFEFKIPILRIKDFYNNNKINLLDTWNHSLNWSFSLESNFESKFFIEISTWCQLNCSYCNIKKVKWNTKSQPLIDLLSEIKSEINNWKTEIFLLSDDCGSYGFDIWTNFWELIKKIFELDDWIKIFISNIYPSYLVKYYEDIKQFIYLWRIPYILVPVQHYSPRILKLMNRSYDVEKIIEVLKDIKKNSKTELHNHIIFNYNEETIDEFMQALKFLNYYDKTFFFKYSDVNNIYGNKHISYDLDKKFILLKKLQKKYNIDISI